MGCVVSNMAINENEYNKIYDDKINEMNDDKILEDFKNAYSDKNMKALYVYHVHHGMHYTLQIRFNNHVIRLSHEDKLIELLNELNRPFVFSRIDTHGYYISFVYGKSI